MPYVHACQVLDYWKEFPPEHEMLDYLARVYTTWKKKKPSADDHQASLEERWSAGALNAKQIFEAMGGGGASTVSVGLDGTIRPAVGVRPPMPGA